jgi:serine/threonine protein phosphatase PrpC
LAEPKSNVGSASHLGETQVVRDSHFIFDYANRRVPLPIVSYLAVADASGDLPPGESPSKRALEMLRDLIEPAVIAEEELHTEFMEGLIRGSLAEINNRLGPNMQAQPPTPGAQVSLTMVIADAGRAYIGHIGTSKVYLLHDDRLFDLVPSASAPVPAPGAGGPSTDAPPLFAGPTGEPEGAAPPLPGVTGDAVPPVAGAATPPPPGVAQPQPPVPGVAQPPMPLVAPPPVPPAAAPGAFLGQAPQADIGFNQVDIVPDDVLILCTDGLWKTISDEELVENLLSTASVQRSTSQLTRVAFSRDASDNATMVVWKYVTAEDLQAAEGALRPMKAARSRAAEALLIALLALVLVGIFAVGFAFGWRITDTFRKPAKEASSKAKAKAKAQKAQQSQPQTQPAGAEAAQTQGTQPAPAAGYPKNATVKGQGVRMRATPDATGQVVGQLSNGQQVSVQGETPGSDGKTWAKIKATISSGGQQVQSEGYVRSDFLVISQ